MPRTAQPKPLASGPWKGVYDTADPFDATPGYLRDLLNGYIADAQANSGAYARNGFAPGNNGAVLTTAAGALYGQAVYTHSQLDGSRLNFVVMAGKLLRVSQPTPGVAMTITDVTPAGITINSGSGPVYLTSMVQNVGGTTQSVLIVNDQVNRPWVGSNLTATPVTGTSVDYDGAAVAWTAVGPPVVWNGAVFFVLGTVGGVARREDISWSLAGDPVTGYQQPTYDYNWTLVARGGGALYGLTATNPALYYFREESIGVIVGGDITDLKSTATVDAVSINIGCTAPQTIQAFGDMIYFCDALGRPYRFGPSHTPEAIWLQMRGQLAGIGGNTAEKVMEMATSAIEPTLNLYLVAPYQADVTAGDTHPPQTIFAFSAATGVYQGRWTVHDTNNGAGGVGVSTMGLLNGPDGEPTLFLLGEATPGSGSLGYGWSLRNRGPSADAGQWYDGSSYPNVQVTTDRLGESPDVVYTVDGVTLVTGNASPCSIGVQTSAEAFPIQGLAALATPTASVDGTYRTQANVAAYGRGPAVRIWPQPSDPAVGQWSIHRVVLDAVASKAGPEEL